MQNVFWIVVYCLHPNLCYVSKDDGVIEVARYPTEIACHAAIHGGRETHKNSECLQVSAVSCFNGGSRCTFAPGDLAAADKLKSMAPMPRQ